MSLQDEEDTRNRFRLQAVCSQPSHERLRGLLLLYYLVYLLLYLGYSLRFSLNSPDLLLFILKSSKVFVPMYFSY